MKIGEKISLKDIISWAKPSLINPGNLKPDKFNIKSISTDSRTIEKGDFFIPIVGENYNGHDFIIEAVKKGASGFIFEGKYAGALKKWKINISSINSSIFKNLIILKSNNNLNFMQDISYNYIRKFNPIIIGITGSVGKTTTKDFIVSILKKSFNIKFTPKNYNTEIGIFKSVLEINKNTQFFIAEIGMRAKGQVKSLSENLNIDIGIITAVGPAHLEFFKNVEEIAIAKAEMAEYLAEKSGVLFLNNDDEWSEYIRKRIKCNIIKFGRDNNIDFNFIESGMDEFGRFTFDFYKKSRKISEIKLPVAGYHNIYNACCAAALCSYLKLKPQVIKEGIENVVIEGKRMEVLNLSDKIVLNDCYNASPLSVKRAIDTLKAVAMKNKGRSVAILGDMLELGKDSEKFHFGIGKYLLENHIDLLITFGNLSKKICDGFDSKKNCYYFNDKDNLCDNLKNILKPGDIILVKGSRANKMESIVDSICNLCIKV